MIRETRFRDIISHESNWSLTCEKIGGILGKKGLQLLLVSKELLLPLDIIGLQIRRSDIVAIDENDNVYLVELKTRIPRGKVAGVETQVGEYKTIFERNLEFIRDKPRIYYYQYILKRYFEFINKDITKIKEIIPVILSMTGVDTGDFAIPAGSFSGMERERVIKAFVEAKHREFMQRYGALIPGLDAIIHATMESLGGNNPGEHWFPLVLVRREAGGRGNPGAGMHAVVFENVSNYKKETVDLNVQVSFGAGDIEDRIPAIYHGIPITSVPSQLERGQTLLKNPRFTIQLFRSGRTDPILYFEVEAGKFLPFVQHKPVILGVDSLVNEAIAFDARPSLDLHPGKISHYDDVILFDKGSYRVEKNTIHGVTLTTVILNGLRYNIKTDFIHPKVKAIPELRPFMTPLAVKEHIGNIIRSRGESYVYEDEWLVSQFTAKLK
ncbi:MAG: hypothetical protein ACTSU9_19785 [Promethearchaeota archaeon]